MRAAVLVFVLLLMPFSGCIGETGAPSSIQSADSHQTDSAQTLSRPSEQAPTTGSPRGEAAPEIQERDPETRDERTGAELNPLALGFAATRTVTLSNDFAQATDAYVGIVNGQAHTTVTPWDQDAYEIVVTLRCTSQDPAEAEACLDRLEWSHLDLLVDGTALELTTQTRLAPQLNSNDLIQINRGARLTVDVRIPAPSGLLLDLSAGSGSITVEDMAGAALAARTGSGSTTLRDSVFPTVSAQAGSGRLNLHGIEADQIVTRTGSGSITIGSTTAGRLAATAGSGALDIQARAGDTALQTGSGSINADLTPVESGTITARAGSGIVRITVQTGPDHGYDIQASAGSGGVQVNVADTQPVGDQSDRRAHVRTTGFDGRPIQTQVDASGGSGGIRVSG